uniref:Transmembrane protein n=1 Tax=Medicago truncatula TaxID=3880 RepID=I3T414_MEDTR|nr:unknown [Medicago truncatula]
MRIGSKLLFKGAEMGFSSKEEKSKRILRVVKTLFFLITMILSLLLFSAPVLLVIADALLPSALLSTLSPVSLSLTTLSSHFHNYDFRYSLIDIPLVSIIRSFIIFCVYSLCDGPRLSRSRGPYLCITTMCSVLSLLFVSFKAVYVFGNGSGYVWRIRNLLCLCVLVRWLWDMLSWPIEQVVEREESFWFTRLTLNLFQLAQMGIRGILRFYEKRESNDQ